MERFLSEELTEPQLELLVELLSDYLERNDDLTHVEYGIAKSAQEILDGWL